MRVCRHARMSSDKGVLHVFDASRRLQKSFARSDWSAGGGWDFEAIADFLEAEYPGPCWLVGLHESWSGFQRRTKERGSLARALRSFERWDQRADRGNTN